MFSFARIDSRLLAARPPRRPRPLQRKTRKIKPDTQVIISMSLFVILTKSAVFANPSSAISCARENRFIA